LILGCLGGRLRSLTLRLRANRAAQTQKQNNREKRLKRPGAQQLNGIH
jgi:hypothetical protein